MRRRAQAVAQAADRVDDGRVDLAAKMMDEHLQHVAVGGFLRLVERLFELDLGEDASRVARETLEQAVFHRRELHRRTVEPHGVSGRVQAQTPQVDERTRPPLAAAHQRPQAGGDLLERGRLHHVVVRSLVEAGDALGERVARRQDQHREDEPLGAPTPERVHPVFLRQAQIEHHGVERLGLQQAGGRSRLPCPCHVHPQGLQPPFEARA